MMCAMYKYIVSAGQQSLREAHLSAVCLRTEASRHRGQDRTLGLAAQITIYDRTVSCQLCGVFLRGRVGFAKSVSLKLSRYSWALDTDTLDTAGHFKRYLYRAMYRSLSPQPSPPPRRWLFVVF